MLYDAHCHLDHVDFDADRKLVFDRTRKVGVRAINAGTVLSENKKIVSFTRGNEDWLYYVLGLSPHDASRPEIDLAEELAFVKNHLNTLVGIGEIGLDYHHYFKAKEEQDRQRTAFNAFLDLAEEHALPVVMHSRDAESDVLQAIEGRKMPKIMHCFMVPDYLERALDCGCFISVPTLKSRSAFKVIERTPLERLLCETDSPFLWHDGRNEPSHVRAVYEKISELKKIPFEKVVRQVNENVEKVFKIT